MRVPGRRRGATPPEPGDEGEQSEPVGRLERDRVDLQVRLVDAQRISFVLQPLRDHEDAVPARPEDVGDLARTQGADDRVRGVGEGDQEDVHAGKCRTGRVGRAIRAARSLVDLPYTCTPELVSATPLSVRMMVEPLH